MAPLPSTNMTESMKNCSTPSQKPSHKIYQRLRFLNSASKTTSIQQPSPVSDIVHKTATTIEESNSVKSLKQFWINAFGGVRNDHKKNPSGTLRQHSTLESIPKQHPSEQRIADKRASLQRNIASSTQSIATTQDSNVAYKSISNLSDINLYYDNLQLQNRSSVENFYKYKNADLVKQRFSRQSSYSETTPAADTYPQTDTSHDVTMQEIRHQRQSDSLIVGLLKPHTLSDDNSDKISSETTPIIASTISKNNSSLSLAASNPESASSSRKTGVSRKCSFRTNPFQPHTRKMASAVGASSGGSKVAALTHRFNQLCEKDTNRIRDEVLRNKEVVLLRTNGKVFKVMTEEDVSKRTPLTGRSSSDNSPVKISKRRSSVKRKERPTESVRVLHETEVNITSSKPKVPDKSEHVLMRKKEIVGRNKARTSIVSESKLLEDSSNSKLATLSEDNIFPSAAEMSSENTNIHDVGESRVELASEIMLANETSTEDATPKKNKYVRLYDKFRFKPSFMSSKRKALLRLTPDIDPDLPPNDSESIQKIVDAISKASQRIELLSKSESSLTVKADEDSTIENIQPNQSFLFRSSIYSNVSENYAHSHVNAVIDAVNPCVRGMSRSMNDLDFSNSSDIESVDKLVVVEDDYEIIEPPKQSTEQILDVKPNLQIETPNSFLYRSIEKQSNSASEIRLEVDCSDMYQSIAEVFNYKATHAKMPSDQSSVNSYESYENYESVDDDLLEQIRSENGYEICGSPPDPPPEPPPPRICNDGNAASLHPSEPPLPIPKRKFQHIGINKSDSISSNYEIIKYEQIPQRPPKTTPLPPAPKPPVPSQLHASTAEDYIDTENIYDTINSDVTQTAFGYERIGREPSFIRNKGLRNSDSASTLSSDNKTNSLYGTAISSRESVSPPSEPSDNNSDDWIDISDGESEAANKTNKLIVVCDRVRQQPRTGADWSQMVRDQRMLNRSLSEVDDDDSDHYYESLHPSDGSSQTNAVPKSTEHLVTILDKPLPSPKDRPSDGMAVADEEYDSFDSDEDTDEDVRKNDSGVDVSNNRLPEPPTPTGQVYAFMQKIRNFGSLSKNLSKFSKKSKLPKTDDHRAKNDSPISTTSRSPQMYENTQFYVNVDLKPDHSNQLKPKGTRTPGESDIYENTEFHTPRRSPHVSRLEMVPIGLDENDIISNSTPSPTSQVFTRKKSKSGTSFKSKLRKSVGTVPNEVGTSFNGARSTFYIVDSIDVDSGVFTNSGVPNVPDQNGSVDNLPILGPPSPALPSVSSNKLSDTAISPEVTQRKSSLTVRPNKPPPPPPTDRKSIPITNVAEMQSHKTKRTGTTSWYAECGVFKSGPLNATSQLDGNDVDCADNSGGTLQRKDRSNSSSWYADAGLYQTSGASIASSSGSSGVSTGGSGDDHSHSMFLNEPLYQIYSAAKLESISNDIEMDAEDHSDGYEEVGSKRDAADGEERKRQLRPSALQIVGPKQGPSRTLWCEIPEVITSEILSTLTTTEKRLQEAKFEILTSEASYLKSLTLLRCHFMNHPAFRDTNTLSAADRKTLFSYMISVQECSDRLLCDLENCWQDNIMLLGLSHSVYKHAEKYFHVYVAYCEHQAKLDRTLKRLKEAKSSSFYQNLHLLESDVACCGLSLHSFLMLPMQRITRLPLLVDAVLSKLKSDDDEYESWKMTLAILNKIVGQCNDAANRSAQAFELAMISSQIEFPQSIRPLAIVPVGTGKVSHRSLVRRGELTHIVWRGDDGKLTFGKRFSRSTLYAFLFTDLLILAKKRDNGTYSVVDYCERLLLTVTSGDVIPQLPTKDVVVAGKHLICMTLLENHEGKMTEMIFACSSETDRQRWLMATEPPTSENPDEKLYEQWDCPQVTTKHLYTALQPDELSLEVGDVVNVTRKMADGWYQGERLRDGAQGWFPGNYTEEVASSHVRARNLKQRYRLLTFTAAYWEAQKRK